MRYPACLKKHIQLLADLSFLRTTRLVLALRPV